MSVVSGDIHLRKSTTVGSAGNTNASAGAGTHLGKYVTTDDVTTNILNNLFPDETGTENLNNNVDYQCVFIYNASATDDWQNVVIWISSEVAGGVSMAIGVDTTAESAVGSASAQALTIANKNTAPAGVSFSAPTTQGAGLSLGTIPKGHTKAFWIRRTAANTSALANDGGDVSYAGDTA